MKMILLAVVAVGLHESMFLEMEETKRQKQRKQKQTTRPQ
jgi:type II secretory pathway component PulK